MRSSCIIYIYCGQLSLFSTLALNAQSIINISIVTGLPSVISESSGLERTGTNCFWSHNDSGGQPELYNFDSSGTLLRTLLISNATNVDWEELTTDTAGNLYIGDFGNNNCNRQDLVIYKIINPDSVTGNSVTAEAIHFTYPDQYAFPPHPSLRNFDMESMITVNDSLYLFTKNQTSPCNGYTKVYRLPLDSGTYVAQLVDSFLIGVGSTDGYSITGARITRDYDTLLLISHERIWIFSGFTGTRFFSGISMEYLFSGSSSNKEGVCFGSGSNVYLSDEFTVTGTQNLYYINLLGPMVGEQLSEQVSTGHISVYPNPFSDQITIRSTATGSSTLKYELLDVTERTCLSGTMGIERGIDVAALDCGVYLLLVNVEGKETQMIRLIKANK
ncbi:MAG TPA: T9SS type A sorting domain-containing protein [Chitinophagaceae bacterium]|nr:T9SS type A sorting domain-containing protein [Chitinophagaceae bacterium]